MSWRILGTSDTGDATHYGGFDMAKISRLFTAVANVDTVDFNSNIFFRDSSLRLRGTSSSNVITVRTSNISGASDLYFPNPTGSTFGTVLTDNSTSAVYNKIINGWDNTMAGVHMLPGVKKQGTIQAGGVTGGGSGTGLLYGFLDLPTTPVRGQEVGFGSFWRYASGTTANTVTGIKLPARWIMKEWNPYFRAKTRANSAGSGTRQYVGLSYETSIPAADTPMDNNESGVLVGWRSTDSNYQVFLNSGTSTASSTPTVVNTNVAKASSIRQIEIDFIDGGTTVKVRILSGNALTEHYAQTFTTNLPADAMSPSIIYSDNTTTSRDYDIFFAELTQDL
ncbi:MAG: hypothetical protein ICV68_17895 [Pyrinomonadaceae bacterium]|nr:hypothetical protein [Pyrinomonadaceae bacterium]